MVVYVWLNSIKRMIQFESLQEYQESTAYEIDTRLYGMEIQRTMVERTTKLWRA
jgi:hypothetical protein